MNPTDQQAPSVAVGVKIDTLGDLVLAAPAFAAWRAAWPGTRLAVVIRRSYVDLARLLAPGVEWLATTLNPFAGGPDSDPAEVERLSQLVASLKPAVLVAATSRSNWLEAVLAARSGAPRRVALGSAQDDEFFATQLRIQLGIDARTAFTEYVPLARGEPDWQRGLRLVETVTGRAVQRTPPVVTLDAPVRALATPVLSRLALPPGRYLVCAAAGFANVALKTWPPERFAAVLQHARARHGLPALLIGHTSEREHLERVAAAAGGAAVWTGGEDGLPQLAALLASAAVFLGNDTGAMHLAAALDVPVVAVFGGGTWPRFVPAGRRTIAVVQPLPCFGCGWDCAFGDAPCIGVIPAADVSAALDSALAQRERGFVEIRTLELLSAETRALLGKAADRYRETQAGHLARQHKLEELTALDREKDKAIEEKEAEIHALKAACEERLQEMFKLDRRANEFREQVVALRADREIFERTVRDLPPHAPGTARVIAEQSVHIRNLESLLVHRDAAIAELQQSLANHAAGRHDLEQAKHYGKLLAEKEAVIRSLQEANAAREAVIRQLAAETTGAGAVIRKLWLAIGAFAQERFGRPFNAWLFRTVVEAYWMQIGVLRHYAPRPLRWDDRLPGGRLPDAALPHIGIVTPSYGQEKFVERTLRSVLDQKYPKLRYAVQDGGSKDRSPEIIARYSGQLHYWESVMDHGQADAIARGFQHIQGALGPDDLMAWLNSDDLLAPGALRFVAEYFARHPDVDVVYGHRIIIDDDDRDVGRWIMPRHDPATLEWIDYVPQETMFWRKRAWDRVGGIDPSFQFALDWDLLARFHQAGCRMVRVPYFLGAFRVHAEQKTTQAIHTTGADEMRRIRTRFHGDRQDDGTTIERHARSARFWGAITARLHEIGIRW